MMAQRRLAVWLLLISLFLVGCAGELAEVAPGPGPGHTEEELVAQRGQPQKILPGPQGTKIYFYQQSLLDHTAIMMGGSWEKPEQTYYYLDPQGVISKVDYYPYGKRRFLLPAEGAQAPTTLAGAPEAASPAAAAPVPREAVPAPAAVEVQAPAAPPAPVPPSAVSGATKPPVPKAASTPLATPAPTVAASRAAPAPAPSGEVAAASTRLELKMSKNEVERLLGLPDRTEGLLVGGKSVVVWFYPIEDRHGRPVSTPLVFKEGRLTGWGENYYQQVMRESRGSQP